MIAGADLDRARAAALALAAHLRTLADGLDSAAHSWPQATDGWRGPAALAASGVLGAEPSRFIEVANASRAAATALSRHAEAILEARTLQRHAGALSGGPSPHDLERQSQTIVTASAQRTAAILGSLAASAPRPASRTRLWLERARSWRGEFVLGAAESTESVLALGTRLGLCLATRRPGEVELDDLRAGYETASWIGQHPLEVVQGITDWSTWRSNPVRAAGHLTPDLLAALASGGTAATARGLKVSARTRLAERMAAEYDAARRSRAAVQAATARAALVRRVEGDVPEPPGGPRATGWSGAGGTRLTALEVARAESFHQLNAALAPSVRPSIERAAQAAGGRLVGDRHQLKAPESFKRKVATELQRDGAPIATHLERAADILRYTIELDEASYTRGVQAAAARLEAEGFHARPVKNAWYSDRYRGINSVWVHQSSGVAVELQFHTPASWRIKSDTHDLYEQLRLPDVPPATAARLSRRIAGAFEAAPRPGWVHTITVDTFPPRTLPAPIEAPPNLSVPTALIGLAGAHALESADRMPTPPRPPDPRSAAYAAIRWTRRADSRPRS